MSKKKKENKHQVPSENGEAPKYKPRYLKDIVWLEEFNITHQIQSEENSIHCLILLAQVHSALKDNCEIEVEVLKSYWGVQTAWENFKKMSYFELTNIFARIWIDNYIDHLGDAVYNFQYTKVWNITEGQKKDREADKAALELQKKFLQALT